MCSRAFRPLGLPIYVARVPAAPFSLLPSSLCLLCRSSHSLHSGDVTGNEQTSARQESKPMFDVAGGVRCREDVAQRVATAIGRTQKGLRLFQATRATLLRNATARQAVAGVSEGASRPCR